MVTEGPVLRTAHGQVRGRRERGCAVFRGIPFARPPFGALRLAAPQPAEPWDGVREAVAFGPAPPQPGEALGAARPLPELRGRDPLDCLTVNVWTPDPGAAGLPVMVWVYGGAYLFGQAGQPMYDGAELAAAGVAVVSFNYRVGFEGFGQVAGAPANRGLLDQVAALRWVAENIATFGGDPGNVTVFGESAGAGSIAALLAMPTAAGLFRRAIIQSLPGTYLSPALAADIGEAITGEVGRSATVTDLADTDPGELVRATDSVIAKMPEHEHRWGPVAYTATPFSPVVDGDVLPRTPWRALADGAASGTDLIAGCNRDEYRLFLTLGTGGLRRGEITAEQAATALRALTPGGGEAAYRAAYPAADPGRLLELVYSDWLFRMPSFHLADAHAAASTNITTSGSSSTDGSADGTRSGGGSGSSSTDGTSSSSGSSTGGITSSSTGGSGSAHGGNGCSPSRAGVAGRAATFSYELCFEAPPARGPNGLVELGACHALDIPLVFGKLPLLPAGMRLDAEPTEEALALSQWIRSAWTRFATDGDPGWPRYQPADQLTQILDAHRPVVSSPEAASRHIWSEHEFGILDLA